MILSDSAALAIVGLCRSQYTDLYAGVFVQPICTLPGSPVYSVYPAAVARQTLLWFFMFPSITKAIPHPGRSHRCPIIIHNYNHSKNSNTHMYNTDLPTFS